MVVSNLKLKRFEPFSIDFNWELNPKYMTYRNRNKKPKNLFASHYENQSAYQRKIKSSESATFGKLAYQTIRYNFSH